MPSRNYASPLRAGTPKPHKWQPFEVRTLICLIIKREHLDSPDDPMDLADKLNSALNPVRSATMQTAERIYGADIPVVDVTAMLHRILRKRRHAVDLSDRQPSEVVTKRKVATFMRALDFSGSEEEWIASGRRELVAVERALMRRRMMAREEGTIASPRAMEEKDRRLNMLRSPRAQRLLVGWGIGGSFWEESEETGRLPSQHPNVSPEKAAKNSHDPFVIPEGHRYHASAGSLIDVRTPAWMDPSVQRPTVPPTPGFGGGFAPAAPTPLMVAHGDGYNGGFSAPTPREPPPALGSFGGIYGASIPQQPPLPAYGGYDGGCDAVAPQQPPPAYGGSGGGFGAPTSKPPSSATYGYSAEPGDTSR